MNRNAVKKIEFGREETKAVKGVAVVLMLYHHLVAFPDRYPIDFSGFTSLWKPFIENEYIYLFALGATMCVSLFFFLGGYGLFVRRRNAKVSITNEILRLYKTYWKVFVIFVPVAILLFANGESELNPFCVRYIFDFGQQMINVVLSDFVALTSTLNAEWWFLKSYICVMILGFFFCEMLEKKTGFWQDMFIVFIMDILIKNVFPAIAATEVFGSVKKNIYYREFFTINEYSVAFFSGIVFAKHDGINRIINEIQKLPCSMLFSIVGMGVLYWAKTYILPISADLILCAFMVALLSVIFNQFLALKRVFVFLGKHSTNMWLIHSFYCYYFLEVTKLVYCTSSVWIDLLILILLSLASSIVLEALYKWIGNVAGKMKADVPMT